MLAALESLPTVRAAQVDVRLPGTLAVSIDERVPVMVWQVGDRRYLADADGTLFALMPAQPPAEAAALPVIDDQRIESVNLDVGKSLDPVDLDAATRLASLVPADLGSAAVSLGVSVTDANGFVVDDASGQLVGGLRVLHAEPADDRDDPRPGPAPAQPARRSRGGGPAGDPRVGDRRDVHAASHAVRRRPSPKPSKAR